MPPASGVRRLLFKVGLARRMRGQPTDAERRLWTLLRAGQTGFRFRRQQPIGPYVVDFFCSAARLVIELDGDHHATDGGVAHDARRTGWLEVQGYRVLRFSNAAVLKDAVGVRDAILQWVQENIPPRNASGISTLPQGEGEKR